MNRLIIILMFGSLLKLLGCTSKNTSSQSKSNSEVAEFNAQIANSIEEFKNRIIHKKLTTAIIDSTSDDDLLQVVFDNLSEQLPNDYKKEYQFIITKFNSSQQAIFLCWLLESEVNNGGFNQYFTNSSGQYADMVPKLLATMDAFKFSKMAEKANRIYKSNYAQISKDKDGTVEGFSNSYENNPLNELDDEFYKLYQEENLYKKQIEFIRGNKIDFVN